MKDQRGIPHTEQIRIDPSIPGDQLRLNPVLVKYRLPLRNHIVNFIVHAVFTR